MIPFYLVLAFFITLVFCVLLFRAGFFIMTRRAGNYISETHRYIEYIINTHKAPQDWIEPFVKRLERAQQHTPDNHRKLGHIRKSAKKTCLKKLNNLIQYTHKSLIIQDEETRQILLHDLTAIQEEWKNQGWDLP